jgi:hypothetical protein
VTDVPLEDPRDALIREQAAEIAGQAERIAALEALIADLREQLSSAVRAGSRNSSMPPSSDDMPGRKPPRKQRRAAERADQKRNRGKQPGSPGAAMRWEAADRAEEHYPVGACSRGGDLADAADLGVSRSYQQEEIPAAAAERVHCPSR